MRFHLGSISLMSLAMCLAAMLSGCWPLPVEKDKHPQMPTLRELKSTSAVQVTQILASTEVKQLHLTPASGKLIVRLERSVPVDPENIEGSQRAQTSLLIFDVARASAEATPLQKPFAVHKRIDGINLPSGMEPSGGRLYEVVVDSANNIYYQNLRYAAPNYDKSSVVSVVWGKDAAQDVSMATGMPLIANPSELDLVTDTYESDSPIFALVKSKYQELGSLIDIFDAASQSCVNAKQGIVYFDCDSVIQFGQGDDHPKGKFQLSQFASAPAMNAGESKVGQLCESAVGACFDKAVAANHCSGNHMVFGCRQSYFYYANLNIGKQKVAIKSVPGVDSPSFFLRLDPRRLVAANEHGVYLISER